MRVCNTEGCDSPVLCKGLCSRCYSRLRLKNPEQAARNAARVKAWREANPGRRNEQERKRYREVPNTYNARSKKWKQSNPEKIALYNSKRRTIGSFTREEWKAKKEEFRHTCPCCGAKNKRLTVDHIVPVALGGTSFICNIQPLCLPCNAAKGAKVVKFEPWANT